MNKKRGHKARASTVFEVVLINEYYNFVESRSRNKFGMTR